MAGKLKLHNPELAKGSKFKNFVLETLSADPTFSGTSGAGRLWFDAATGKIKMALPNADGTGIDIKKVGEDNAAQIAQLQTDLSKEVTRATTVEGDITQLATNDKTNLTVAINEVVGNLSNEVTRATGVEGDLTQLNTTDKSNLVAAISSVKTDVDGLNTSVSTNYFNKTTTDAQTVKAPTTFDDAVVVKGDLIVKGTTTTIETQELKIADNIITLNSDFTSGAPSENAGIEVLRGDEGTIAILQWNESDDRVEVFDAASGAMTEVGTKAYTDAQVAGEKSDREAADDALDKRLTKVENQTNGKIGDLNNLTTDDKNNLVAAINEVDANADAVQTQANDIQNELDTTQTGAGLDSSGQYVADGNTNYIGNATSLFDADKKLDAQIKINAGDIANNASNIGKTNTGAGLGTDGSYAADGNANYISSATSLFDADKILDAQLKAVADKSNDLQTELDGTQTGAGLGTNGSYTADSNANYISSAASLFDADKILDTQLKTTVDDLASTDAGKGTELVGYEGFTDSNVSNAVISINAGTVKNAIDTIASSVNAEFDAIKKSVVKAEFDDNNKADEYTIQHNLGTTFVDVSVQVYDEDDQAWRFDLVVVEVVDANTVKISLSNDEPQKIRYVIKGF